MVVQEHSNSARKAESTSLNSRMMEFYPFAELLSIYEITKQDCLDSQLMKTRLALSLFELLLNCFQQHLIFSQTDFEGLLSSVLGRGSYLIECCVAENQESVMELVCISDFQTAALAEECTDFLLREFEIALRGVDDDGGIRLLFGYEVKCVPVYVVVDEENRTVGFADNFFDTTGGVPHLAFEKTLQQTSGYLASSFSSRPSKRNCESFKSVTTLTRLRQFSRVTSVRDESIAYPQSMYCLSTHVAHRR